jgi:hypothetical protein
MPGQNNPFTRHLCASLFPRSCGKAPVMKKLGLVLLAASAAVFGFGMVAAAQTYSQAISLTPPNPSPGQSYTAAYGNCTLGDTITFTQSASTPATVTGRCVKVSGVDDSGSQLGVLVPQQVAYGIATAGFAKAPTAPGTYTVTASGLRSPTRTATFTIAAAPATVRPTTVVPAAPDGGVPVTGSSGSSKVNVMPFGLLAVAIGLLVVAQVRRMSVHA